MTTRFHGRTPEVEAFEQHLLSVRGRRGQLRYTPRTARLYANHMNRALALGGPLAVLRGAKTTALWLQAGNAVLAWARWKGDTALEARIADVSDPKVATRETELPPLGDWARVLAAVRSAVPEPRRQVLLILLTSGLRIGDVFRLSRDQVSLIRTNRCLVIGQKGDHARKWRPGVEAQAALARVLAFSDWRILRDTFDVHQGEDLTELQRQTAAYYEARKTLIAVCADAGVDFIRLHRYRHGVAERAHARGAPLERIQEMLGHRDPRTTKDHYLHLEDDAQAALADDVLADIEQAGRDP
jgi:integrase